MHNLCCCENSRSFVVQSAVASVGEDEVAAAREVPAQQVAQDCAKLAAPSTGGSPAATAATPVEDRRLRSVVKSIAQCFHVAAELG
eukprot:5341280-Amphidinium_carterae.3